jgi:hypothetical protein
VPWHLIPLNIYFIIFAVNTFRKDDHRHEVERYLAEHTGATLRTPLDLIRNRPTDLKILVSTLPELDFPLVLPDHVIPCGPIIRSASPISDVDRDLDNWLSGGPTIYINLGSICRLSEDQAAELAQALRIVLDASKTQSNGPQFRILWKIKKFGEYDILEEGCKLYKILGEEIEADLVKIVDWVEAEPIAILRSGHVVCSIHHGGANSYNEAVR